MRVGGLLLGYLLLSPLMAAAEPSITWDGPAECPGATAARAEVAGLLVTPLPDIDAALTAAVRIRRVSRAELEARISIREGARNRTRRLRDGSCTALTHAAAVVVALAIDATTRPPPSERGTPEAGPAAPTDTVNGVGSADTESLRGGSLPAADAGETSVASGASGSVAALASARVVGNASKTLTAAAQTAPAPVDAASASEDPEPDPAEANAVASEPASPFVTDNSTSGVAGEGPIAFVIGVAGALGLGTLPNLAPAVAVSAGLSARHWRAGLRVGYAPAQHARLPTRPDAGGHLALASVAFDGGVPLRFGIVEIPLLLGVETGVFDCVAEGDASPDRHAAAWLAPYVASGLGVRLSRKFSAALRVEGLAAVLRPQFALEEPGVARLHVLHQPAFLSARAYLGLEAQWP